MRKPVLAYAKTKAQISCPVTFVFATYIPLLYISENKMPQAIFYGCTPPFVSDLVGNPNDSFIYAHFQKSRNYSVSSTRTTTDQYLFMNWGGQ